MSEQLPVFVYGTLRAGEVNASLLDGVAVGRTSATLPAHRLHLLEYPCVIEDTDDGRPPLLSVRGELVSLAGSAYGPTLERLDWLEGYDPEDVAGSLYVRVTAAVETDDGPVACWVYLAGAHLRSRLDATNLIASGDWSAR